MGMQRDGERDASMPGQGGPFAPGLTGLLPAALPLALHLPATLQSHQQLLAGARSTHMGGPHPCSILGTTLSSPCKMGLCVWRAPHLLSPAIKAMNSQRVQSQMKQGICRLFSLTEGKGPKPPSLQKALGEAGGGGREGSIPLFSLARRSQDK